MPDQATDERSRPPEPLFHFLRIRCSTSSGIRVPLPPEYAYRTAGQRDATYRAVNACGAHTLLDAAQRAGVARFVHCSTVGVHGHVERPHANEDAPLTPGDIYQNTKLEGEQLARAAGREGAMEVVVDGRPGSTARATRGS